MNWAHLAECDAGIAVLGFAMLGWDYNAQHQVLCPTKEHNEYDLGQMVLMGTYEMSRPCETRNFGEDQNILQPYDSSFERSSPRGLRRMS